MSHLSVRTLIEDVAKSLADNLQFGYGRRSEFNQIENKRYPYIWLLPLTGGRRFLNDTGTKTMVWDVALVFLDLDEADSNEKQTAEIHDRLDYFVDRFMENLDTWSLRLHQDTVGDITIRNDIRRPFFKEDTDTNSGWLLTFQLQVPDEFDYCTPENVDLYAGEL